MPANQPSRAGRNTVKTIHVTPASLSLEVLLRSRLGTMAAQDFDIVGYSTDDASGLRFGASGFGFIASRYLTRNFSLRDDIRFFFESLAVFRRERPYLVNTYGLKPGLYGRVAARLAGVPVVIHTSWGLYFEEGSPWFRKWPVILLEKAAACFCDYIFSVNKDDLELMKRYRFKPAHLIGYLGNATDVEKFCPPVDSGRRARLALGIDPETVVIGMIGRLTVNKGYHEFFQAARAIRSQGHNVIFVVVGPEDESRGSGIDPEEIRRLEQENVIRYLGSHSHEEMADIYSLMDVVVLMSHREGFPRSLVEAAAMGKPVVATDIRGCREAVEDGRNGYLVPVGDSGALVKALEQMIGDSALRDRMGSYGRQKALAEFDEEMEVARIAAVYHDFIQRVQAVSA